MTPILCYHPPSGMPAFDSPPLPEAGIFVYWPSVNMLTTDSEIPSDDPNFSGELVVLQEQHVSGLPENAIVVVMIWKRGTSHWKRTRDTSDPATEVDLRGLIVPSDYDPEGNPFLLHRVAGF